MSEPLRIGQSHAALEVDLWGEIFLTKPATRSVAKQADELQKKVEAAGNADELMDALGEMLDLRLAPAHGKRTKASTLISRKWRADELTPGDLIDFCDRLAAAERPT